MKFLFDLFPVILFFAAFKAFDIFVATGVVIVATAGQIAWVWHRHRKVDTMLWVSLALVVVFGGATLLLHDATFVKMKATIVYLLFALALLGGLLFGKALLSVAFDSVMNLSEEGWRKLTLRWGLFFLAMAGVNEFVWRTQTEAFWVNFKVFGFVPLTILFAISQTPLMLKYELKGDEAEKAPEHL